jgi:hypothetical protein
MTELTPAETAALQARYGSDTRPEPAALEILLAIHAGALRRLPSGKSNLPVDETTLAMLLFKGDVHLSEDVDSDDFLSNDGSRLYAMHPEWQVIMGLAWMRITNAARLNDEYQRWEALGNSLPGLRLGAQEAGDPGSPD